MRQSRVRTRRVEAEVRTPRIAEMRPAPAADRRALVHGARAAQKNPLVATRGHPGDDVGAISRHDGAGTIRRAPVYCVEPRNFVVPTFIDSPSDASKYDSDQVSTHAHWRRLFLDSRRLARNHPQVTQPLMPVHDETYRRPPA